MRYSTNKDFNKVVATAVRGGQWQVSNGGRAKHPMLVHTLSGYKLRFPFSPKGDAHGLKNLQNAIKKVEAQYV